MDILYISSYPIKYFEELITKDNRSTSLPSQRFNHLMVKGLNDNGNNVTVLSTFNHLEFLNRKTYSKFLTIYENSIKYDFIPFLKIFIIGKIFTYISIYRYLKKWNFENPNGSIIIDILKPYSFIVAKYHKQNSFIEIVTDLPEHLLNNYGKYNKLKNKIILEQYMKLLNKATQFIFLTEHMNSKINTKNKSYRIIEGLIEPSFYKPTLKKESIYKKICLYSGSLQKKYGIQNLVKAFLKPTLSSYELHLYGSGDYENELSNIIKKNSNIKYYGVLSNEIVLERQKHATILINPRPTKEEFTYYSFPSKNLEYMVSGRPVLTTKLGGMPEEYLDYVIIIEDESEDGIANTILNVFKMSDKKLDKIGEKSKQFVEKYKNHIVQTKKILDLIEYQNELNNQGEHKCENFMDK
jgi:glycosyltransferase involved in cell wall biosynthesis